MKETGCTPARESHAAIASASGISSTTRREVAQIHNPTAKEGGEGNAPPPDPVVFGDGCLVQRVLHRKTSQSEYQLKLPPSRTDHVRGLAIDPATDGSSDRTSSSVGGR